MSDATRPPSPPHTACWPLPLAAGLLPALAALAALWLSASLGLIPACNPFLDGCVSISRAARHDLPNHLFRALTLPGAALQALTWMACAAWLRALGADARGSLRALPWLGALAAAFLVLYGTFLGTEGQAYRWMRRYGVIFYFGFTYLCMVIATGSVRRLAREGATALPVRFGQVLVTLCAGTLAIGLAQPFLPKLLDDPALEDRLENLLEWYVGIAFTLFFVALAWGWRRTRMSIRPVVAPGT